MAGRKSASRALPMNTKELLSAIDKMLFELRDVVTDVIYERKAQFYRADRQCLEEGSLCEMHDHLPIAPGKVRRRCHRAKIRLPFRGFDWIRGELPIRQLDLITRHRAPDELKIVVANLVSQVT